MTTDIVSPASLYTLPIELLYRIFDILDNETILFQFRNVCKRFYFVIQTYNQYKLNFQSISKSSFHSICRLIQPENVSSLTLSNDNQTPDQIKLFLLLFNIEQFTRLRSLTLIQIDENDFHRIFQSNNILSSLSFTIRNNLIYNSKTLSLISSIISNPNLRYLDFSVSLSKIEHLSWPNQCFLQTLIIFNRINIHQFSTILSHSIYLKKFVLQDCLIDESVDIHCLKTSSQLISLTFEDSELQMNDCEIILSLTPSLEHFQIVGGTDLADGFRWEKFIQMKLLYLKKFQFAVCGNTEFDDLKNVQSLITSFQTPFWIEEKNWFVVCYYFKQSANYSIYSLPICKLNVRFYPHKDKVSYSTYPGFKNDQTLTDNVNEMQLNLTNLMAVDDGDEMITSSNYPFFRKLNKLILCVHDEWPIGSVEHLSTFIDLSCIVEISISLDFQSESTVDDLIYFFKQMPRLHSLTIDSSSAKAENICLIVPDTVKHLQVSVKNMDDMKIIIERFKYLSSVTFEHLNRAKILSAELIPWLMENRNKSTYRIDEIYVSIWFHKIIKQIH